MQELLQSNWLILAIIWTVPWKGWALWRAARANAKWWFIALLIINTMGILEILYIFVFSKKDKPASVPTQPASVM